MEVRYLHRVDYAPTYAAMQEFTDQRSTKHAQDLQGVPDQLWICEHNPVFTQGLAGKHRILCYPETFPWWQPIAGGKLRIMAPDR